MKNKNKTIQIENQYVAANGQGKVIIERENPHKNIKVYIETSELDMLEIPIEEARELANALTAAINKYDSYVQLGSK